MKAPGGSWRTEGTEQRVKLPHVGFYCLTHSPCPDPLLLHASLKTIPAPHAWSHHTLLCTSEPNAATENDSEAFQAKRKIHTMSGTGNSALLKGTNHPQGSGACWHPSFSPAFSSEYNLLRTHCGHWVSILNEWPRHRFGWHPVPLGQRYLMLKANNKVPY